MSEVAWFLATVGSGLVLIAWSVRRANRRTPGPLVVEEPWAREAQLDGKRSETERAQARYVRDEIDMAEMERELSAAELGWPILGHTANCSCPGCVPPKGVTVPWR